MYSGQAGFVPPTDSPSHTRPQLAHEAAPFALCYGPLIWLAPLTGYNPTGYAPVEPSRHIVGASSARLLPNERAPSLHIHIRAIDVITSFQVIRCRSRDLVHV